MKPTPKDSSNYLSKSWLALSLLLLSLPFNIYSFHKYTTSHSCKSLSQLHTFHLESESRPGSEPKPAPEKMGLHHVVFGLGVADGNWANRKQLIKYWWRPGLTRGFIWVEKPLNFSKSDDPTHYPEMKVSSDTSRYPYTHPRRYRRTLRLTRIISEMVRLRLEGVRWFVVGDDDTVFFPDNLVRVLRKYNHTQMYYIGSNSESHISNILYSYGMAFGGGGYAISYPLAVEIERMQDRCLHRYGGLMGSDDRIFACVSDLGVPLTKEPGFHQLDINRNAFGLLAAHPIAPLVSLHHLDQVSPILPAENRLKALERLAPAAKVDSAALMQQSICYDSRRNWTVSVSWGYAVQIVRGTVPAHEMARPVRTFVTWKWSKNQEAFSFESRPISRDPCHYSFLYFFDSVEMIKGTNKSRSEYGVFRIRHPPCAWKVESPKKIQRVEVYKVPDPNKWDKAPRRDCCRVLATKKEDTMLIDVGECREWEVIEPQPL